MMDIEYPVYGAPRPLKELLRRMRPLGMASPALPDCPAMPARATLPLRFRVTPLMFASGLGPGTPATRVLAPLKPNLVLLMIVGESSWVTFVTAFCGTIFVL